MGHRRRRPEIVVHQHVVVESVHPAVILSLRTIEQNTERIMTHLADLEAAVQRVDTVTNSARQLITNLADQLREAADDPERVRQLASDLTADADALADAVTANTPDEGPTDGGPDVEPAPEPTPAPEPAPEPGPVDGGETPEVPDIGDGGSEPTPAPGELGDNDVIQPDAETNDPAPERPAPRDI